MTAAITDFSQYAGLRAGADQNDPQVLREVAGQFEALFVQSMLKNMRAASLAEPVFGQSDQHEMYQDMLDQQLSIEMSSGAGIGLAEMLVRQLGGGTALLSTSSTGSNLTMPVRSPPRSGAVANLPTWSDPAEFARDLWPHARRVARRLNVAPEALLAQAALETGWGEHVISGPAGSSNNLFGIKAGGSWDGESVRKQTLEISGGVAHMEHASFRAYPDLASTFNDYARFIEGNPRYNSVQNHGDDVRGFADALQASGYATDPQYADKITRVLRSDTMQSAIRGLKTGAMPPITSGRTPELSE